MNKMIEVRYAGVVVGRTAIIRELDTRGLFLGITEPLPVGTPVVLRISDRVGGAADEDVPGRVELVSESQELAHAGMRVRFADPGAAVRFGAPVEAPPEPQPEVPVSAPDAAAPGPADGGAPATASLATSTATGAAAASADHAIPDGSVTGSPSGPRRIVVDASADRLRAAEAAEAAGGNEGDAPDAAGAAGDSGRIPAPDPSAFGASGGGKKGRRNRRR